MKKINWNFVSGFLVVLTVTAITMLPLFGKGFIPTHDGEYHLIRFMEFYKMLSQGYLFPRWAPGLNSGFGIPIFNFQYPLPNYIGSLIHLLGFSFLDSFKISSALGYMIAALCLFIWLSKKFGYFIGTMGAISGALIPYWFLDVYIRGSIGEIWGLAFVNMALVAYMYKRPVLFTFTIAAVILSHNIMAMIFIPLFFLYCLIYSRNTILSIIFGIGISAYFWMPALYEQKYVVGLNPVNYQDHFPELVNLLIPSWGTEFSRTTTTGNVMSFQIGVMPIIVLILSLILIIFEKNNQIKKKIVCIYLISIISILLMLKHSLFIWKMLPFLAFIQYPWRLLSLTLVTVPILTSYVLSKLKFRILNILFVLLTFFIVYPYMHPVIYEPRDDLYYKSRINFTDGTSSMGNSFSTIWTAWITQRANSFYEIVSGGKVKLKQISNKYMEKVFLSESTSDSLIQFNTLYYPGWRVDVDKKEIPIDYKTNGIIRIQIPSGFHTIRLRFTETDFRILADMISIICFSCVCLIGLNRYIIRKLFSI